MVKYIAVKWPEYQHFMEHPRFKEECYFCTDSSLYFIPEDLYNEVTYKLQFPKVYKNTNLGTITCYETRAIVNGEDIYWYDNDLIERGKEVLVYKHDSKEWVITNVVACSFNMPILLEDKTLLPGLNCEIIGIKNNG